MFTVDPVRSDRLKTGLRCESFVPNSRIAVFRKPPFAPNETVMLQVLIFIGLAIILISMTATTEKPQRMTKEAITRGWLRDALDKALSEDKAQPSPVQQLAFSVKHGKPETDKAA